MLILDTDTLTLVQQRRGPLYQQIVKNISRLDDDVAVTIISFEEQLRGWLSLIAQKRNVADQLAAYHRLTELLRDFQTRTVLDFDADAAREFEILRTKYRRHGVMDLKIAAISLARGATLATRNKRDFEGVDGLAIVDLTGNL